MPPKLTRASRRNEQHDPLRRSPRHTRQQPPPRTSDDEHPGLAEMALETEQEPTSEGVDAEIHVYERRLDSRGIARVLRVGSHEQYDDESSHDPSCRAAFVLMREYRSDRSLQSTALHVKSPYVRRALRQVIKNYPGVDLNNNKSTQLSEPPMCLYHFRSELWKYAIESRDPVMESHMDLCLRYMRKALKTELLQYGDLLESIDPALEHRHLWMVFKPGELLYGKSSTGTEGLWHLVSMRPIWKKQMPPFMEMDFWELQLLFTDNSQSGPRQCQTLAVIPLFEGRRSLNELHLFPVRFHPEESRIRRDLLDRGRKFLAMVGIKHLWYDGTAHFWPTYRPVANTPLRTYADVKHRIIIDHNEFEAQIGLGPSARNGPASEFPVLVRGTEVAQSATEDMREEDILTCTDSVRGFSLAWKKWGVFQIDSISDLKFDVEAFGELLLASQKKDLIRSLVEEAQSPGDVFDDLIKGKGRGLVLLLHGPPGVGKTYTAESIADYTQRPLLRVSSGQLTDFSTTVEDELSRYFRIAAKWKAILLIDEADVFLQERSSYDLPRNRIVSSFLRLLEYFEGTLILTTNRAATIDTAFHSRIHLSVAYPNFSPESLRLFWKSWIIRACDDKLPRWVTDQYLDDLSQIPMSGRDVKNILRVAGALAKNNHRPLSDLDIRQGVVSRQEFQAQFPLRRNTQGASRDS